MHDFSISLTNYLIKQYGINISDIQNIIEDEWDYIEQEYVNGDCVEVIAKELVDIYMVA